MGRTIFHAEKIPMHSLSKVFDQAPALLTWAFPVMILLIIAECYISHRQDRGYYDFHETIGTAFVAAVNVLIGFLVKALIFVTLISIYNFVPWRIDFAWWTIFPCYLLYDFCSYWAHRISHKQRIWWATHVVHHSSEHYNLFVSARQSWLEYFKMIFLIPVLIAGFHPVIIFIVHQVAIIYQFWVHTEYIPRLHPVIEYIFVTPSSHRVHHGAQKKYINKNYGGTFIIWDRIFRTYQQEEEHPIFGITENKPHQLNPLHINFHEYQAILQDLRKARGWRTKLFYLFGDPVAIARRKKAAPLE